MDLFDVPRICPGKRGHFEVASGQDFLSFMHDKVFSPLGMQDTLADESDKIIPNRARWYTIMGDGTYRNTPYEDLSYKWAGGGFLSTAENLARFGSALFKPAILKQDTLAMIFSPHETNAGEEDEVRPRLVFIHDTGDGGAEQQFEHSGGVAGKQFVAVYLFLSRSCNRLGAEQQRLPRLAHSERLGSLLFTREVGVVLSR